MDIRIVSQMDDDLTRIMAKALAEEGFLFEVSLPKGKRVPGVYLLSGDRAVVVELGDVGGLFCLLDRLGEEERVAQKAGMKLCKGKGAKKMIKSVKDFY